MEQKSKTTNWKAFGGKYLKAEDVTSDEDKYVITKVESEFEEDKNKDTIILTVERDGISKLFGCNVTNEQAVKAECSTAPDEALERIVTFNKVQVERPGSAPRQMVDGLRIQFVPELPLMPEEPELSNCLDEEGVMK